LISEWLGGLALRRNPGRVPGVFPRKTALAINHYATISDPVLFCRTGVTMASLFYLQGILHAN